MMFTAVTLFSVGFAIGLGIWWMSLDRRRGREVRKLAHTHRLPVDAVHEASARALRYGFVEDFTFLVRKAHPQPDSKDGAVQRLNSVSPEKGVN
ncbi:MAG: hypothetical protein HYZ50_05635 [Deltaproteobacteria bacterium]|nr:hypothetical protein [Deltaproteobacteria bacterium]